MRIVLVHGWGFHAGLWDGFTARLNGADVARIDLGFVRSGPESNGIQADRGIAGDAIAVGHSLGLLWLLENGKDGFKGLVSIQGFDRYCPHVPEARVAALKRGVGHDPGKTLQAFWRSCGAPDFALPSALNVPRLDEGLDWLMHWDAEPAKKRMKCPVLALASQDDTIVPPAMSAKVWGERALIWSPGGGHVLPLSRPDWCAQHVLEFAHSIPS